MINAYLILALATIVQAGPYQGVTISTGPGTAVENVSGYIGVAASSKTPTTYSVFLDGVAGSVTGTYLYGNGAGISGVTASSIAAANVGVGTLASGVSITQGGVNLSTVTTAIGLKFDKAGGSLTGQVTIVGSSLSINGAVLVTGATITASGFVGSGAGLTNISAAPNISASSVTAGILQSGVIILPSGVDLSTVTTVFVSVGVATSSLQVQLANVGVSTLSIAVATTTLHTEQVVTSRIDFSTITTALGLKLDSSTFGVYGGTVTTAFTSVGVATATLQAQFATVGVSTLSIAAATTTLHTEQVVTSRIDLSTITTALAAKLNSSIFATYGGTVTAALATKLDNSVFATYSDTVTTAINLQLSQSSAALTYLNVTSATANYLNFSSASVTYLNVSSATSVYLQKSSATANYLDLNTSGTVVGSVTASGFIGSGQSLTNLNGSQILSGTIPSIRIDLSTITTALGSYLTTSSATLTYINVSTTTNGAGQLVRLDGAAKLPAIDGSQLTNLPSGGGAVLKTGDTMTGTLYGTDVVMTYGIVSASATFTSTVTVNGNAFSVGGSTFVVNSGTVNVAGPFYVAQSSFVVVRGFVGISTAAPFYPLSVVSQNSKGFKPNRINGDTDRTVIYAGAEPTTGGGAGIHIRGGAGTAIATANSKLTIQTEAGGGTADLSFYTSSGTLFNPALITSANRTIGEIYFASNLTNNSNVNLAFIDAGTEGVPGGNTNIPTWLRFATASTGTATATEKMRLSAQGYLGINNTSPNYSLHVSSGQIEVDGTAGAVLIATNTGASNVGLQIGNNLSLLITRAGDRNNSMELFPSGSGSGNNPNPWIKMGNPAGANSGSSYMSNFGPYGPIESANTYYRNDLSAWNTSDDGTSTSWGTWMAMGNSGFATGFGANDRFDIVRGTITVGAPTMLPYLSIAGLLSAGPGGVTVAIPGGVAANAAGNATNMFTVGASTLAIKYSGNIGIGTSNPATKLHMSSGTLTIDGTSPTLNIGDATNAGTLVVAGASYFGSAPTISTFTATGNFQLASGSTISTNGTLIISTAASAALTLNSSIYISTDGHVGISTGVTSSNAILTVGGGGGSGGQQTFSILTSSGITIGNSGPIITLGTITAGGFTGSGSNISNLSATNVTSGILSSTSFLPAQVVLTGTIKTISVADTFSAGIIFGTMTANGTVAITTAPTSAKMNNPNIYVQSNSGYVGVNTSTPTTSLSVYGVVTSSTSQGTMACNAGTPVMSATCEDDHCTFLAGIAAVNCTYTFFTARAKAPDCICGTDAAVPIAVSALSTTTTVKCTAAAALTGDNVTFICEGAP